MSQPSWFFFCILGSENCFRVSLYRLLTFVYQSSLNFCVFVIVFVFSQFAAQTFNFDLFQGAFFWHFGAFIGAISRVQVKLKSCFWFCYQSVPSILTFNCCNLLLGSFWFFTQSGQFWWLEYGSSIVLWSFHIADNFCFLCFLQF